MIQISTTMNFEFFTILCLIAIVFKFIFATATAVDVEADDEAFTATACAAWKALFQHTHAMPLTKLLLKRTHLILFITLFFLNFDPL